MPREMSDEEVAALVALNAKIEALVKEAKAMPTSELVQVALENVEYQVYKCKTALMSEFGRLMMLKKNPYYALLMAEAEMPESLRQAEREHEEEELEAELDKLPPL